MAEHRSDRPKFSSKSAGKPAPDRRPGKSGPRTSYAGKNEAGGEKRAPAGKPPEGRGGEARSSDRNHAYGRGSFNRGTDKAAPGKNRGEKSYSDQRGIERGDGKPAGRHGAPSGGKTMKFAGNRPTHHERGGERGERGERGGQATRPPNGGLWIYGTHAVAAALANPARRTRRLMLTSEAEATLAAMVPKPWAVGADIVDRDKLDALLGRGIVHQGAAILADPLNAPSLTDCLKRPGPILVLDQVTDPRNIGAILRSAQAFGVAAVITQDRNAPEETGALAKAASGALEKIPLLRTVNIARALIALKAADLWVVGLDANAGSILSNKALGGRRVALVLGAEGEGMRRLTRETCDELVAMAMPGGMESLNVSVAGAVALYELTRAN
jgi:23S rRNA (guanosine2251-2'-O)-methyltransferase